MFLLGVPNVPPIAPKVPVRKGVILVLVVPVVGIAREYADVATQTGVSSDEAEVYAEGLRRGGALVSARVADGDAARLRAVMDRSAVRIGDASLTTERRGGRALTRCLAVYPG